MASRTRKTRSTPRAPVPSQPVSRLGRPLLTEAYRQRLTGRCGSPQRAARSSHDTSRVAALPRTGRFELCSRATDAAGNTQPYAEVWSVGGVENNVIERVPVLVVDS